MLKNDLREKIKVSVFRFEFAQELLSSHNHVETFNGDQVKSRVAFIDSLKFSN